MNYLLKVFRNFRYYSDHPVTFAEPEKLNEEYKDFLLTCMSDCSTSQHIHERIKEFKLLKSKNVTSRQKAFALIYTRHMQFPEENVLSKKYANASFLMILSIVFVMVTKLFIIRTSLEKFMDTYTIFVTRK